ncbi:baseplate assembly protein [Bradyrhizobium yuanmingense]|uniref:baseplate assembly protein n=1 Tax=Bradyrhizobium yuanmingense TaxID=108015 RepID=UPI0004B1AA89|nr:baseplate J/gp47 family protein [Bradyrhizobium yuanmingense]
MAGAFTNVNLSQLPVPDVVEQIDFEAILTDILADFIARMAAAGVTYTALVESDPLYKLAEAAAYREVLVRQRANESAKAVMLALAVGADLDQLGANVNVQRLLIDEGDPNAVPPVPPTYESDEDFRARIQLSFEGYTTAGSEGSYVFHALTADGDVKDISATSPTPGVVNVYVLSRSGDGTASPALVAKVDAALNAEDIRPMTDHVIVASAEIVPFAIEAVLTMYPGPDPEVVRQAALDKLHEYISKVQRIGYDVTRAGIIGALVQPGVQNVALASPAADVVITDSQAPYCSDIDVTNAGATDV